MNGCIKHENEEDLETQRFTFFDAEKNESVSIVIEDIISISPANDYCKKSDNFICSIIETKDKTYKSTANVFEMIYNLWGEANYFTRKYLNKCYLSMENITKEKEGQQENNNEIFSNDKINHPSHYNYLKGIEAIDICRQFDFDLGNSLKYIIRAGHKQEQGYDNTKKTIEDLEKAIWYLKDKIKTLKEHE